MREASQRTREQLVLRIGAVCLIVGSVLIVVFRTLHGDLPTDTGESALSYVASYPIYPLVHLVDVFGFLIFAGGLVALSASLTHRVAWAIGCLGVASVLVGAAVHIVDFSIDGFGLPMLANAWAVASPSERASLELGARLVLAVIGGPSVIALTFVWGSTLALYGLAVKQEGYSSALGWTGVMVGAALFVMGTIFYLKPNIYPWVLRYVGGTWLAHLWAIVLGIAMWRRAAPVALANALQQ